jgi:hypothetical protein
MVQILILPYIIDTCKMIKISVECNKKHKILSTKSLMSDFEVLYSIES